MKWYPPSCWLLIAAVIILLSGPSGAQPVPSEAPVNVHYVDSLGSNFLFRGGTPCTGTDPASVQFNYEGLKKAIAGAALPAGVNLPPVYAILDVSLLWTEEIPVSEHLLLEREHLFQEYTFFKSHPDLGKIQMWTTKGTGMSPLDPSLKDIRDYLALSLDSWLRDPLVNRVDALRRWLADPSELGINGPVVVYVHCFGGCDRTGELIGSYALRYQNKSWEEMNDLNRRACRGGYLTEHCNALRWYGLRLNLEFGRTLHWDSSIPCAGWTAYFPLVGCGFSNTAHNF